MAAPGPAAPDTLVAWRASNPGILFARGFWMALGGVAAVAILTIGGCLVLGVMSGGGNMERQRLERQETQYSLQRSEASGALEQRQRAKAAEQRAKLERKAEREGDPYILYDPQETGEEQP